MPLPVHAPTAEPWPEAPVPRARGWAHLRAAGAAVVVVAALGWVLPKATGASWSGIAPVLVAVRPLELVLLTAVWAAGLLAYSYVLTGALPGLSRRRALTLNLTGSAVSNVTPMGGALGVGTNLMMVRAWQFRPAAFAAFTVVTNIWDVMGKLVLPLVALFAVLGGRDLPTGTLRAAALTTGVVLGVLLSTVVLVLRSDRVAGGVARTGAALLGRLGPRRLASRAEGFEAAWLDTRARVAAVMARTWPQLTLGTLAYLTLQGALLWACLHAVGATPSLSVVVAGFAVERLLTLAVITPGGTGLVEAGTGGVLVALGVDPLLAAAGVLLYRGFTFFLEIPVGAVWLGGWVVARARAGRQAA